MSRSSPNSSRKSSVPHTIPDEPLPKVVAALLAKMFEKGAVGLRQIAAMAFAFGAVGRPGAQHRSMG